MGIQQIEVYTVTLKYKEPFRIAPGANTESRNVIVKILTDYGVIGWGESSPSRRVTGETPETVVKVLGKFAPKLIGMCPLRIEQDVEMMDSLVKDNPAAKAAIDMALYDILGKTCRKPLYRIIGGYRTEVLTDLTLSIKSPKEMARDAVKALRKGFKALKVKVGVNPNEDFERIKLIREAVGEEIQIRIDANQGWTPKQAIEALNKMEKFNIQFAEQPVSAEDTEGLREVKKNSPIPIMADESVHSPKDALRLIQAEAVDLINIKLMKSGGILKGRKIAEIAEAAGIPCMIGCMGESEIGIAAGTHLAAATKNIQYADLDSDILMKDKLAKKGGTKVKNSMRIFPKENGLGIKELNEQVLGKPKMIYK
ncbi:MAG: dipeptide epimerase [Candidatus Bathyarchaeota archaeon]|nr:dipeptide epimerase [Candidatus Bathyarchaeota archaeon A05DMB-5]MDH7558216.1 dipeptide epimerase [Candidatus Bathyarchaeota archaeon]